MKIAQKQGRPVRVLYDACMHHCQNSEEAKTRKLGKKRLNRTKTGGI